MSQLTAWILTPFARALGWTLVHFLWEGAVLGGLLAAILRVFRDEPPRRRYAAACLVLAAMPAAFAGTFSLIWILRPLAVAAPLHWAAVPLSDGPITAPAPQFTWTVVFDRLAWLVPAWLLGVAIFYARALAGWAAVRRLRRRGVCAVPEEWQARLDRLAARLRVSRPVTLLESCFTDTPVLIGCLRPVILLPLGCLTGLSVAQVECILLHELAHVARRDYVVNLLQSLVEGLLFYHPAVWWVSRMVRAERENCCDDRAVELMGDARAYAATLAVLEERRALAPVAAMAANGGNLMKRIRRLTVESRGGQASVAPAASAAVLLVLFAAALTALPARLPKARPAHTVAGLTLAVAAEAPQQTAPQALPTPYRKWLNEDVAYIISDQERAAFVALASDAERDNFIVQFWERRDPTSYPAPGKAENPFREEHYRRIAYANAHLAGSVAGWKTDRGRLYITYGPPDEIDDHSESSPRSQTWRYKYIDGIGTNVVVEFVDRNGTGDYQMTKDPAAMAEPYRKWLNEDAAYIITPKERAEFLSLTTGPEREKFIERFWQGRGGRAVKAEHYRRIAYANENFASGIPGWKTDRGRTYITYGPPNSIATYDGRKIEWTYRHIDGVGNNVIVDFEDSDGHGEYRMTTDPPGKADVYRRLQMLQGQLLEAERWMPEAERKAQSKNEQEALTAATVDMQARVQRLQAELVNQHTAVMKDSALAQGTQAQEVAQAQIQDLEAQVSAAQNRLQAALRTPDEELIRKSRDELAAIEQQLESVRTAGFQDIQAKTLEIQAALALRNEELAHQTRFGLLLDVNQDHVTVVVPLSPSSDRFHVFGEVRNERGKIVQSFESDVSGEPSLAKTVSLGSGRYRMEVVVKDLASGAASRHTQDFTVN